MTYRITREAELDIDKVDVEGAERFGTRQAERYVDELFELFDLRATNPFMARERHELRLPVRLHPHRAHLVIYRVREADILIVRVLSGRQDWQSLFT